jgi:iron transport multicopper oxidase
VTSIGLPKAPFSISGQPTHPTVIPPNGSFTATIGFTPTALGNFNGAVSVGSTAGTVNVPLTGVGAQPAKLVVAPLTLNFGAVAVGGKKVLQFTVSNTGGSTLTITRSKPPIAGFGFTATSTLAEGTAIAPGAKLVETITFTPTKAGAVTDNWSLNGDDGGGVITVTFNGS